ncbi:unnamed protein product, partial [Didymodactylos carnosus]
IKYLLTICYQQLQELESRYKDDGVDILSKLPVNEIVSSGDIFEKLLRPRLLDYASVNSEAFDLSDCNLANEKEFYSKLVLIAQPYGCHLEMKTAVQKVSVNVPTTLATEYADQPTEANAVDKSEEDGCTKINRSEIKVVLGDLTTEKADIIVVCSNSDVLKSTILKAAGLQVADEYNTGNNARQKLSQQPCDIATSPGYLKCKKILFLPWKPVPSLASAADQSLTRHSVSHFVKTAIDFAFASNYKSIAFPAIGTGNYGIPCDLIASAMITQAKESLEQQKLLQLAVSFVLLRQQLIDHDEFVKQLAIISPQNYIKPTTFTSTVTTTKSRKKNSNTLRTFFGKLFGSSDSSTTSAAPAAEPASPPPPLRKLIPSLEPITLEFDKKIAQIILTTAVKNWQNVYKCRCKITEESKQSTVKRNLDQKSDLCEWRQSTLNRYFQFCLQRNVLVKMDIENGTIELEGPSESSINEAEKHYYELTNETLKQSRMHATTSNSSPRLPPRSVPANWSLNDKRKRIPLQSSLSEYTTVLQRFNETMVNNYLKIVRIERIQNERWYKQYKAHRDEFKERFNNNFNEKLLFHGSTDTVADQIVNECFNRSFAGVNGR